MKKLALFAAAALLAAGAYTADAAPVTYVPAGHGNVGYTYNGARAGIHNVHVEYAPVSKVVVGVEVRDWINHGKETDIYAKYRLGRVYLGLGNRNYHDRDAHVYGLIEGMTNVAEKLDAYAGWKFSGEENEYKVGVLYDLMPSVDIDVNYTYYDRDHVSHEDGVGVGVNYRF